MQNPSTIIIESLLTQALLPLAAAMQIATADQSAVDEKAATQIDQLHTSLLFLYKTIRHSRRAESRRRQVQED